MASGGGDQKGGPSPPLPPPPPHESRWLGQGYADITKLREIGARHDHVASKYHQRAARAQTKIDKLRHQATVLREKAQAVLAKVPELEAQMAQYERDIQVVREQTRGATIGSDATDLQYRVRKVQQKIADLQLKARSLELKAAQRTQKTAELKVKVDEALERARGEEGQAAAYRQRADRLQAASEAEMAAHPVTGSVGPAPQPPSGHA